MISFLKGTLEMKMKGFVAIDVNGVGYKVFMSDNGMEKLGHIGDNVKVFTYYRVSENDISLFGFNTNEELSMFELLLSVSGVGAKTALAILAAMEPSAFALAVISNDINSLKKLPGIGAKSAQRIVLELQDKLKKEDSVNTSETVSEINKVIMNDAKIEEAISALRVLGYSKREIEKSFENVDKNDMSVEDLIKKGLSTLSNS